MKILGKHKNYDIVVGKNRLDVHYIQYQNETAKAVILPKSESVSTLTLEKAIILLKL